MKALARRILNRLGYDVVRTRNMHHDLGEHLKEVLRAREIDCVLDVGANGGQYAQSLRALGFEGHIVSFEPVAAVFEQLKATAAPDPKWSCHRLALGDTNEEKTINVYESTMFSSFHGANRYAKGIWKSLEQVRPEAVRVVRLDDVYGDLVARLGVRRCLLKLDTQGYDKIAFDGARGCLQNVAALQSELSFIPVYEGTPAAYDVLRAYHDHGFHVSGMYPVNRDPSLAVIEYDCVLVRRDGHTGG